MILDSVHRFLTGDFIRIGGQLGPWAAVVGAFRIDPLAMGPIFLVVGVTQLIAALLLLLRHRWGDILVLAVAVRTLWYLIFGTVSSLVQIVLVLAAKRERLAPR